MSRANQDSAEPACHECKPEADGQLHCRVTPGDPLAAVAAFGPENQPAQERDVVQPADGVAALRAARSRADDGFVLGEA